MSGLNLLVFRGDRRRANGKELKAALIARLEQLRGPISPRALVDVLLLAGEVECGVADAYPGAATSCERLTDQIADALLATNEMAASDPDFHKPPIGSLIPDPLVLDAATLDSMISAARVLPAFDQLSISTPEGFAYYALHPLAYADVIRQIPACERLLVVGIRSIGTTLSAVAAAAVRARGISAQRTTVRPQGHPYNRTAEFAPEQMVAISKAISCGANFAVVDEGPGLSGSSFLAVAEALERAGASTEKIILVSAHEPNINALCAENAARRWQRFHCMPVVSEVRRPAEAVDFIGGGQWRSRVFANECEWPDAWTSFERLKYLSSSGQGERWLFKFAGLGHYGDVVLERERKVAVAGFGPMPRQESEGFISYALIEGRPLLARDLSKEVLAKIADYCAFRQRAFAVELSDLDALQGMSEHNLHELGLDMPVELRLECPVIADGKMQRHEWLWSVDGKLLKTDSGSHGDDHFFPGPTDIAWDLAGAIVEWKLNEEQTTEFLNLYHRASGDDAVPRIGSFIRAYTVFRLAYCLMAANAMTGLYEQPRLQQAAATYRSILTRLQACILAAAV
jgi:adenine/guanine phosphoribosyltransferase-like PRPP-binding protein